MARIRTVKIGFFRSEALASLSFAHRLLFEGLWLLADREGRLEDRPRTIRAELFPFDDNLDVDAMLTDLAALDDPFIARYTLNGRRYIQVRHFLKHQRPHLKEPASEIPPEPCNPAEPGPNPVAPGKNPAEPGPNPVAPRGREGKGREGKGTEYASARATSTNLEPVWRTRPATGLLNGAELRRHQSHAWCSWPMRDGLCVPAFLHAEFLGKSARSDDDLRAWYADTLTRVESMAIGEDAIRFWRNRLAAWIGSATVTPSSATREGRTLAALASTLHAIDRGEVT